MSAARGAASEIINLLDSVPNIDAESTEGKKLGQTEGAVRFEDVHFRYPTRPQVRVLRGLNFSVKPVSFIKAKFCILTYGKHLREHT
jgi:ATP-binding cassette subfamily B (MDR/TAP) protein 1